MTPNHDRHPTRLTLAACKLLQMQLLSRLSTAIGGESGPALSLLMDSCSRVEDRVQDDSSKGVLCANHPDCGISGQKLKT
eukprot:scaffold186810_cov29-Prasinocladus_malaysianus.AAC.1